MHKGILISLSVLFYQLTASAQSTLISYEEAVKIAIEQNIDIKREDNALEIIRADKLEVAGRFLPVVSINNSADQSSGRQFDQTAGQIVTQTNQRLGIGLNASLLLFNGFSRINSIKQVQYNFQAQQNNKERIKQQVIFLTTQQFLQVLLDKELLKVAEQNLMEQRALSERLKEFSDVGNVPVTDYYNQNAVVKRIEMERLRVQNQLMTDKALLAQTLQLDPEMDFDLEEPDWIEENLQKEDLELKTLYELALQNRHDYKQQNLLAASENLNIKIARGQLLPRIGTYYSTGSIYTTASRNRENGEIVAFSDQLLSDNLYSSFGLFLDIPIFNGFTTRSRIMRAKRLAENSEYQAEDLKRTIFTEVQASYLDYLALSGQYDAAQTSMEAAEIAFEAQKERFSVGLGNLLEYNTANTTYISGKSELVQAQYSLAFQKIITDFYTGVLKL